MQYKVPQFIEVEDKIFGPFTLKQFAYLAGGFGLSIIIWRSFADYTLLVILLVAPVIAFSLALAFMKPNGKPFIFLVQNFIFWLFRPKKLFWRSPGIEESKKNVEIAKKEIEIEKAKEAEIPKKLFSSEQISAISKDLDKPKNQ